MLIGLAVPTAQTAPANDDSVLQADTQLAPSYQFESLTHLPQRIQHGVMAYMQTLLEVACFQFAQHELPDVLAQHRWDCAEAVDLARWVSILRDRDDFPPIAVPSYQAISPRERHEAASALLSNMASLRHAAVDRHRLTINEVEQYIGQATAFLRLLGATSCLERLTPLQETVSIAVHHLGEGRNASTTTLNEVATYTAGRRAELEALERATRDQALSRERAMSERAGEEIERTMYHLIMSGRL